MAAMFSLTKVSDQVNAACKKSDSLVKIGDKDPTLFFWLILYK